MANFKNTLLSLIILLKVAIFVTPESVQILLNASYICINFMPTNCGYTEWLSGKCFYIPDLALNVKEQVAFKYLNVQPSNNTSLQSSLPSAACGGILTARKGQIQSPNYPDSYPPSITCTWDIVANPSHFITINVINFDIEGSSSSTKTVCDNDRLEVYDTVSTSNGSVILEGYYCGRVAPKPITSHSNTLRLVFTSNSQVEKGGFLLNYVTGPDPCSVNNGNCFHGCRRTSEGAECKCQASYAHKSNKRDCVKDKCYYEISTASGTFASPDYPLNYTTFQKCKWQFWTTPGHRVQVQFRTFAVEYERSCEYDSVVFYDGLSTRDRTLGKFCGYILPAPITSSGNRLQMTFTTDHSRNKKGFLAEYSSLCGGQCRTRMEERHIYSHATYGHEDYPNGARCEWVVTAPKEKVVTLTFSTFRLENDCLNDYVEVLDEANSTSTSMGRFCGAVLPDRIVSTGNTVRIRFISNEAVNDAGFSILYKHQ